MLEACGVLRFAPRGRVAPIAAADVRTPIDHYRLHQDGELIADDAFLWSSDDVCAPSDLPRPGEPIEELLAPVGGLCFADLSGPKTRPFHVIRALVPGLVPIAFGHDCEPLGLPRAQLNLSGHAPDRVPHPFP